jgi:hypothetical protein
MKNKTCTHCGNWMQDHKHPPQEPEKLDEVIEGYSMSLLECLQSYGFESITTPLSHND